MRGDAPTAHRPRSSGTGRSTARSVSTRSDQGGPESSGGSVREHGSANPVSSWITIELASTFGEAGLKTRSHENKGRLLVSGAALRSFRLEAETGTWLPFQPCPHAVRVATATGRSFFSSGISETRASVVARHDRDTFSARCRPSLRGSMTPPPPSSSSLGAALKPRPCFIPVTSATAIEPSRPRRSRSAASALRWRA